LVSTFSVLSFLTCPSPLLLFKQGVLVHSSPFLLQPFLRAFCHRRSPPSPAASSFLFSQVLPLTFTFVAIDQSSVLFKVFPSFLSSQPARCLTWNLYFPTDYYFILSKALLPPSGLQYFCSPPLSDATECDCARFLYPCSPTWSGICLSCSSAFLVPIQIAALLPPPFTPTE